MSKVVTVRIPKDTQEKIKKHRINVSEAVRNALLKEIKIREDKELRSSLKEAGRILRKVPKKRVVRAVRESRDQR